MISRILESSTQEIILTHLTTSYQINFNSPDTQNLGIEHPITIEEVRNLINWISFTPTHQKSKFAILYQAHQMSTEAANALLKILEEPPDYAQIILISPNTAGLIPTIISRCLVTKLELANSAQQDTNLIDTFLLTKPFNRAAIFPNTREAVIDYLHNLLSSSHELLKSQPNNGNNIAICKKIIQTIKYLDRNVHLNLAIDNLCLYS